MFAHAGDTDGYVGADGVIESVQRCRGLDSGCLERFRKIDGILIASHIVNTIDDDGCRLIEGHFCSPCFFIFGFLTFAARFAALVSSTADAADFASALDASSELLKVASSG